MGKRITIVDISKKTGYSVSAVSKALSDAKDISSKTKKIILEECEKLGYVKNINASSLKKGNSKMIAIIHDSYLNPFYSEMIYYLEVQLKKLGYSIIIYRSDFFNNEILNLIQSRNVEGIISFLTPEDEIIGKIKKRAIPIVVAGRRCKDLPSISQDNVRIGELAAECGIENGCHNYLFIGESKRLSAVVDRYNGFKEILEKNGIRPLGFFKKQYIPNEEFISSIDKKILKAADCIFCFNDAIAIDLKLHFLKNGGSDCIIIGVDRIQDEFPLPFPMISIGSDKREFSNKIIESIVSQIKSGLPVIREVLLDVGVEKFNY